MDAVIKPVKSISKLRGINVVRAKIPVGRFTMIEAATEKTLCFKKGMKIANLCVAVEGSSKAYNGFLGVKPQKLTDSNDILQHVTLTESVKFYQNIEAKEIDEENTLKESDQSLSEEMTLTIISLLMTVLTIMIPLFLFLNL